MLCVMYNSSGQKFGQIIICKVFERSLWTPRLHLFDTWNIVEYWNIVNIYYNSK